MNDDEAQRLFAVPDWQVEPAPGFADGLEARLLSSLEEDEEPQARRSPWLRIALAGSAAGALIVVISLTEIGEGGPRDNPVVPPTSGPTTQVTPTTPTTGVIPGDSESIAVSTDEITVGPELAVRDIAQDENRTYVLAGRESTAVDDRGAMIGVLAAFDTSGDELWRVDLDGIPNLVAADDESVWVTQFETGQVVRLDPAGGEEIISIQPRLPVPVGSGPAAELFAPVGLEVGFGSAWVHTVRGAVARIEPDGSWTAVEIPLLSEQSMVIGVDAIWVALGNQGVARIDAKDNQASIIPTDVIGHNVSQVAVDDGTVFVGTGFGEPGQVTSLVGGMVRSTVTLTPQFVIDSPIRYLGDIRGEVGVLTESGVFSSLMPETSMVIEAGTTSNLGPGSILNIQGEAWIIDYPSSFRRIGLIPLVAESPIPVPDPNRPRPIPNAVIQSPDWEQLPTPPVDLRFDTSIGWTGSELFVWTGASLTDETAEGAAYNPDTGTWRPLDDHPETPADPREEETNELLSSSELSPNSRDGVFAGNLLVAVDYLLQSAVYDPDTAHWTPAAPVPLAPMECYVRVHTVAEMALVDYCGQYAVGRPNGAWTPISAPLIEYDNLPAIAVGGDTLWALHDGQVFRFSADIEDPTSLSRVPIGPTYLDLPDGWSLQFPVEAEPIFTDVTGPDGGCSVVAHLTEAAPMLAELAEGGYTEVSVEPAIGGESYTAIEYTTGDGVTHIAWPPQSTLVMDISCTDRQATDLIWKSMIWPWQ